MQRRSADRAATPERSGIAVVSRLDEADTQAVQACVARHRRPGDRIVVSMHWGANWVGAVPEPHRRFAHRLIDLVVVYVQALEILPLQLRRLRLGPADADARRRLLERVEAGSRALRTRLQP